MLDDAGRQFDGDAVLSDSTGNCGDSLQPGLTGTYALDFKTPGDTKPAGFSLVPDSLTDETSKTWDAPSG